MAEELHVPECGCRWCLQLTLATTASQLAQVTQERDEARAQTQRMTASSDMWFTSTEIVEAQLESAEAQLSAFRAALEQVAQFAHVDAKRGPAIPGWSSAMMTARALLVVQPQEPQGPTDRRYIAHNVVPTYTLKSDKP